MKMNHMVKKLLSLNQIEFGTNPLDIVRFDIVSLIRSVLISTDILIRQKEVLVHFEETSPCYVWADEYLIVEVVTNYISNAINPVAGMKVLVIKLIKKDDLIRVSVYNTCDLIPEDAIEK